MRKDLPIEEQLASFEHLHPIEIAHHRMVSDLAKPGELIADSLTPAEADLWHAATGIASEAAGELLDAVKKHVIYKKPLDRPNIIEELGDLEFYMEQLRQNLNISREETLGANIAKLGIRYGDTYTDAAAQARVDKSTSPS